MYFERSLVGKEGRKKERMKRVSQSIRFETKRSNGSPVRPRAWLLIREHPTQVFSQTTAPLWDDDRDSFVWENDPRKDDEQVCCCCMARERTNE